MEKPSKLSPEKQAISDRLRLEIDTKFKSKKDLATTINRPPSVVSRLLADVSYSVETRNILIAAGIDMDFVEGISRTVNYDIVNSTPPPPEISPHPPSDCAKISAEMETVKGMMEFYRSELEAARKEIAGLWRDKFEMQLKISELEADARQQSGRSMVERGNTANATDLQKVTT